MASIIAANSLLWSTTSIGQTRLNKVSTNQSYIENISQKPKININSKKDVFSYVFNSLPNEVTVYPTENYFYFSFYNNGFKISGNIRLDALDRDKGIAHFAYFSTYNMWNEVLVNNYQQLRLKDGLKIIKVAPLRYKLIFANKTVIFNLNDLSKVTPPKSKIRNNEEYIGPVFDESGIQLYLVYNKNIKQFHYILNDNQTIPDALVASASNKNIFIGTRTGFAFYKDQYKNRLILIGVYDGNSMLNNYFDGPFDQLPDNFIKDDSLKNAFIDQRPELKNVIDRFGNTDKGSSRVLIIPYIHYSNENQLSVFATCTQNAGKDIKNYYSCFSQDDPTNIQEEE